MGDEFVSFCAWGLILGVCDKCWAWTGLVGGVWKASLLDKEAQGRRRSTEEEREPAFIRHPLLWQAIWVITFNCYYAVSHYSLPER